MSGIVKIHGKDYKTVALRVNEFRESPDYKHYGIETEIVMVDSETCIIRAIIKTEGDRVIATGIAQEDRTSTKINKTSFVEVCETSAIGRALAALGLAGTEYASANEVSNAVINQAVNEATEALRTHNKALDNYLVSVLAIKEGIMENNLSQASESWYELDDDTKKALWLAPTNGGIFSTKEREVMKSTEFRTANGSE